jgi:hypothetical protein
LFFASSVTLNDFFKVTTLQFMLSTMNADHPCRQLRHGNEALLPCPTIG